jgi:hypothetical protein
MKIRLVVAPAGLAISFALPAFAQEKEEFNPFPFRALAATPHSTPGKHHPDRGHVPLDDRNQA